MIERFQYLTQDDIPGYDHLQLVDMACKAGVKWVQLRTKDKEYKEWFYLALESKKICSTYSVKFIINDNPNLAAEIDADGVHIGKSDMHPREARKILGSNKIIGGTANTINDIIEIEPYVDYIGLGPFALTFTKQDPSPVLGIIGYKNILQECFIRQFKKPIIAIGGIKVLDISNIFKTGVFGIAVSSAINESVDKIKSIKNFIKLIPQSEWNKLI